jgi:hypothetical protein
MSGPGRLEKQYKRAATSFEDKLAVIQHFQNSKDMRLTVEHFYPGLDKVGVRAKARVVYRWVKERHAIEEYANSAKTSRQLRIRRTGSATTLGVEGERQLVSLLRRAFQRGEPMSPEILRTRALEVARLRCVPEGAFVASSSWQKRFLDRHRDELRVSESDPVDAEDEDAKQSETKPVGLITTATAATADAKKEDEDDCEDDESSVTSESGTERRTSSTVSATVEAPRSGKMAAPLGEQLAATTSAAPTPPEARVMSLNTRVVRPKVPQRRLKPRPLLPRPVDASPSSPAPTPTEEAPPAPPTPTVAAPVKTAASEATSPAPGSVPMAEEDEERAMRRRRAEIEERKAELLNESIRFDNVLKRIKIAEENALARKRLRDAGVSSKEIDVLLPVVRE